MSRERQWRAGSCDMPSLPLRPCSHIGCRELIASGQRCPEHGKERGEYEAHRVAAHKRGYDHAWNDVRDAYIRANPWCQLRLTCQQRPITQRLAAEVHHKQSILERPDLRLEWSNLASACGPCHDEIERLKRVSS